MKPILANLLTDFGVTPGKLIAQSSSLALSILCSIAGRSVPVVAMLEARRKRIADGEAKLEKIARDLAAAEENAKVIISKADADANRLIKEAGEGAAALAEKKRQASSPKQPPSWPKPAKPRSWSRSSCSPS